MTRYVTVPEAARRTGYTEHAIRTKIRDDWSMIKKVYGKWISDADPDAGLRAEALYWKNVDQNVDQTALNRP